MTDPHIQTSVSYAESTHVPNLYLNKELDGLLGNPKLRSRVAQPRRVVEMEIVPNVENLDPRFHRVLLSLNESLKAEEWQPVVDPETGLSVNFIAGGADRILSVPGVKKLPVSCPIDSNESIRAEIAAKAKKLGFPFYNEAINEHELKIFDWVCEAYFGKVTETATASIRKKASTMLPDFLGGRKAKDGDIGAKKEYVERLFKFVEKNRDRWIEPKEWHAAGFYLGYLCVERLQADTFEKERWANTGFEYVKTSRLLSEMKATQYLPNAHRLAGMRVRTAYGASGTISYGLSVALAPIREAMFDQYSFTYKHRTPKEVAAKINNFKAVLGVDVTQYDQSIPAFLLERLCKNLATIGPFSQAMASLHYYHVSAYAIAPCPYDVNDKPWLAPGSLFDLKGYSFARGLASGTPANPDIGKIVQTFEILSRAHRSGVLLTLSLKDVQMFLKGHRKLGALNSSDDTLLLGKGEIDFETLKKIVAVGGYLLWDVEAVPSFLGTVYGGSPGAVVGYPNIMSYFNKRLNPESGIGKQPTDQRYHWRAGFVAQDYHYGVHPKFPAAVRLLNSAWQAEFGHTFTSIYEQPAYDRDVVISMATMSEVDRLVMMKPEAIYYMVSEQDVSPEVLAMTASTFTAAEVNRYCSAFHKPDRVIYNG